MDPGDNGFILMMEKTKETMMWSPTTRFGLRIFSFFREKHVGLNRHETVKYPLFIISNLALFFTNIRR